MEFEIPDDWSKEALGDLGRFHKGRGGPKRDDQPEGVPVIRYGELYTRHHDVVRRFHSFVSQERAEDYTPLKAGDLLFAGAGETAEEIGKSAVFLGPEPAHGSGDMIIFRPGEQVDPLFLGYASNGRAANAHKVSVGQGSSILHIYGRDLKEFELPLPPLPEQKKIAAILSRVDDAIAATRGVVEQTKRVKKGLLRTLMTRGIGHTRFRKTEIGEIPEEWEVRPLSDVASVDRGKFTARPRNDPKYYGGDVPFVQTGDVTDSDVVLSSHTQTLNEAGLAVSRLFPPSTILITIAANIGEVAQASYPVAFPDSVVGIQAGKRVDGRWLLYFLETRREHLNQVATQNAQKNINLKILRPLPTPLPDLTEQRRIASRLDAVSESIWESEKAQWAHEKLKRGLMQDLLTGRVRVQPD